MIDTCKEIFSNLQLLRTLSPIHEGKLEEDLRTMEYRLEIIDLNWGILSNLKNAQISNESENSGLSGARFGELSESYFQIEQSDVFTGEVGIVNKYYRMIIKNSSYILLSEIANLFNGFARILIRQMGLDVKKPDGWNKFFNCIKNESIPCENYPIDKFKNWFLKKKEMSINYPRLLKLVEIRGMIQHGSIGNVILEGDYLVNVTGKLSGEPESIIEYSIEALKEVANLSKIFTDWIRENKFIPKMENEIRNH